MGMVHSFTSKCAGISMKLINNAVLINGDYQYEAKRAQWDTGATITSISKDVAEKLKLKPNGTRIITTPLGEITVNEYNIDMKLQNDNVYLEGITVVESEIGDQGIDVLIGMDIITRGDFAVSNLNEKTYFTFRTPSQEHVNY